MPDKGFDRALAEALKTDTNHVIAGQYPFNVTPTTTSVAHLSASRSYRDRTRMQTELAPRRRRDHLSCYRPFWFWYISWSQRVQSNREQVLPGYFLRSTRYSAIVRNHLLFTLAP